MIFDPVKYKRFERDPIGKFEAQMDADGWAETRYANKTSSVLLSEEISEFIKVVESFFHECPDWLKLYKFMKKNATELRGDFGTVFAMNVLGKTMDYTFRLSGTNLEIEPYRKAQHTNYGKWGKQ